MLQLNATTRCLAGLALAGAVCWGGTVDVFAGPTSTEVKIGKQKKETVGLVSELSAGDVACYVTFKRADGVEFTEMADFEICELTLVGKQVKFGYQLTRVLADSCGGNPDCKKTVQAAVIVSAKVVGSKPQTR